MCHHMQTPSHENRTCSYFLLDLGVGVTELASLRGRPRGRLSEGAGLPEGVAPALLRGGDGPCSEGSRLLSSDDILYKDKNTSILRIKLTSLCAVNRSKSQMLFRKLSFFYFKKVDSI